MKNLVLLLLIFSLYLTSANDNESCLRCHKSVTLSVIDEESGIIKSFFVDKEKFQESNHKDLNCTFCHTSGFEKWPHKDTLSSKLNCVNCHDANSAFLKNNPQIKEKFQNLDINHIYDEFRISIHSKELGNKFSCFSCHNPHSFERDLSTTPEKIASDNQMCLNCHNSEYAKGELKNIKMPPIELKHQWLPNTKLHWSSVRCIDCHTSYDGKNMSHNILSKEKAVKKCESCHTENSVLKSKLYKHEHNESIEKNGFINGILLSDAYIIGSTRNKLLDNISVIIFISTFAGIFTHGFLRWKTKKNKHNNNKKG